RVRAERGPHDDPGPADDQRRAAQPQGRRSRGTGGTAGRGEGARGDGRRGIVPLHPLTPADRGGELGGGRGHRGRAEPEGGSGGHALDPAEHAGVPVQPLRPPCAARREAAERGYPMRLPSLRSFLAILLLASPAAAQTPHPEITYILPNAVRRDTTSEV